MRLGLQVPNFTWPTEQGALGDTFALIAERAERAGLYSLWVMDHFFQIPVVGPAEHEMLEGWSALAFAAGRTNRIRLGTLVTGVTYRHPGLLVKTATTLDVLSHGRSYFGIGAAWYEEEHRGLGVPFPPLAERFERLEETLQIALQMWAGDERPFRGKHYQLERPLNAPRPVQQPHPPILIGGGGERKTLRLVARYADACNLFAYGGREQLQHKLAVLREHCETIGRPYEQIEKTTLSSLRLSRDGRNGTLSPAAAVDFFGGLAELGIDQAIFSLPNVYELEPFELLATEIVPQVEKIAVAGR
ncbi:LLM class F420-dependent oxidoreductase [Thermogemmatispora tikiterensis]|uniref:LLM class F420-dependent oxidoreductase n=1 Tax=Thermogemmatispora tikiterensis TaxID=1825093 RepID=A0A328VT15_9CHLR|nr:LLM class F420-dependent oxidoreductase [Thermogemmatispora tikiterensis]RAQ97255.1 LLM class F420-dependent oxidoreductase [Thermogemmatispora tikiterensis]